MLTLAEARSRILAEAEPGEAIEVALTEAVGLVLAEPALADVDLPPFDRAAVDGYAVRASEGMEGARLRVIGTGRSRGEIELGPGQASRISTGDPMPVGADAVVRTEETRPEPSVGPPRLVQILRGAEAGRNVIGRGFFLEAGTDLAPAGTRIRTPMVALLASQGCVHPVCFRRVRVAVLAVGDHLVGPGDAPVMHRERNAAGPTVVAPCNQWGACAHDLGTISETDLEAGLSRALTAPIAVILSAFEGPVARALSRAGVEPVFSSVSIHPGKRLNYGVVRRESGRVSHHVFQLSPRPVEALTAVTLLVGPLVARLQGDASDPQAPLRAVWEGAHRPTDDRLWAVPVTLRMDCEGRLIARPIDHRGKDDLVGFARAEALALLPAQSGPWHGGEIVEVVPMSPWPA